MTQTRKRLGLSLPISLYEKISDYAEYHGKTINSACLDMFWEYFKGKETQEKGDGGRIYEDSIQESQGGITDAKKK